MKYFDISMPVQHGMLSWPSDPDVELAQAKSLAESGSNVTRISAGTHFGTHIDAPRHFSDSAKGVDELEFEALVGPVVVVDMAALAGDLVPPEAVEVLPEGTERVIFKTANTLHRLLEKPFTEDYVALSGEAAESLAARKIKLVGIDYLSIQKRGEDRRAHTALLDRDIVIIEGLWLADVPPGEYELIALPLRIAGGDGAPARVLLRQA